MQNETLKSILGYLEFIMEGNGEFTQELNSPHSVSLVPGIFWGTFSILIGLFRDGVVERKELPEVISYIKSLQEKYPKVTNALPFILTKGVESLKNVFEYPWKEGVQLAISEHGNVLDRLKVVRCFKAESGPSVELVSLELFPDRAFTFVKTGLEDGPWCLVEKNEMDGNKTFSVRGHHYDLQTV